MLKLSDVHLELATTEFITLNELNINRDVIKKAIDFGSKLVVELKQAEFDEMMDEMYMNYMNEQAIKQFESHLDDELLKEEEDAK